MCILLSWLDRVSEYWICAINVMVTKQVGNLNLVFIGAWIGTHVFFLFLGFIVSYCSVVGVVYSLSLYRYFFSCFGFHHFFFPAKVESSSRHGYTAIYVFHKSQWVCVCVWCVIACPSRKNIGGMWYVMIDSYSYHLSQWVRTVGLVIYWIF